MTGTPPTLQPIEDAPEGVDLMLWLDDEPWPGKWSKINGTMRRQRPSGNWTTDEHHATHFTLWPTLPKPKTTWDEYLVPGKGFDCRSMTVSGDGFLMLAKNKGNVKKDKALRDLLLDTYPITQDNE